MYRGRVSRTRNLRFQGGSFFVLVEEVGGLGSFRHVDVFLGLLLAGLLLSLGFRTLLLRGFLLVLGLGALAFLPGCGVGGSLLSQDFAAVRLVGWRGCLRVGLDFV